MTSALVRRLGFAALALLLMGALPAACGGGEESKGPSDPGLTGPYPIGVTELTFERNSTTTGEPRTLRTIIWYPADESAKKQPEDLMLKGVIDAKVTKDDRPLPIIMFSHGSGGTPYQSIYYTRHLASHGFVVVAPPHPGNTTADCLPCTDPAGLVDSFLNRPDDITFVLDGLLARSAEPGSLFYDALDAGRVGMSGHSFGGLDTLRLAVGDSRFLAALAMAPPGENIAPRVGGKIEIPAMLMGGALDEVTTLDAQQAYFDSLGADGPPHFLLIFLRGGHLSYSDICVPGLGGCGEDTLSQERAHELVNLYATAFFKTYVAKEERYESYLGIEAAAGNADIEYEAVLPTATP
jgi:predicted dienelactone hydrolase